MTNSTGLGWSALFLFSSAFLGGCTLATLDGEAKGAASASASVPVSGSFAPRSVAAPPPVESHCSPAPALLRNALCVCDSLEIAGSLETHAPAGRTADVGAEGRVKLASGSTIRGSLWARDEIESAGSLDVGAHLWGGHGVRAAGSLEVGGDLASGGDLRGAGSLSVHGAVRVAGRNAFVGSQAIGGRAAYSAPVASACGCEKPYDVGGAVAVARTTNDNASSAISAQGIVVNGAQSLTLGSGRFYVKELSSVGALRVMVEGNAQLYIDGDLEMAGSVRFALAPSATLDLFVAGNVRGAGSTDLGEGAKPEAFRLYVGGTSVKLAGSQSFRGLVYAPTAEVDLAGSTEIHGSLFAGSLDHAGSLDVTYAGVATQGERCEHPIPASPEVVTVR